MNSKNKPCPFCGGEAIEYCNKEPVRDICNSWIPGSVTATIHCSKCSATISEYVDCGLGDPTDADETLAIETARKHWNNRI